MIKRLKDARLTPAELAWWAIDDLRKKVDRELSLIMQELEPHLPKRRYVVTQSPDEIVDPATGKVYPIQRRKRK